MGDEGSTTSIYWRDEDRELLEEFDRVMKLSTEGTYSRSDAIRNAMYDAIQIREAEMNSPNSLPEHENFDRKFAIRDAIYRSLDLERAESWCEDLLESGD